MSSLHLIVILCFSHLKGVVTVAYEEVLLELQRPLASLGLNERHTRREFLLRLLCEIQQGGGAAEGHFHLLATVHRGEAGDIRNLKVFS